MALDDMSKQVRLKAMARQYVGEKGIAADAFSSALSISMNIDDPTAAHLMKPAQRYEDYIRKTKLPKDPALADEIMRISEPELVAQFDDIVGRLNAELQKESYEGKTEALKSLLEEYWKLGG